MDSTTRKTTALKCTSSQIDFSKGKNIKDIIRVGDLILLGSNERIVRGIYEKRNRLSFVFVKLKRSGYKSCFITKYDYELEFGGIISRNYPLENTEAAKLAQKSINAFVLRDDLDLSHKIATEDDVVGLVI